uniref:Uncharacterized protein n=1 Tax=viral metagenome TaxID=1070528 RepID=A0A6C0BUF7_9ZZZZ
MFLSKDNKGFLWDLMLENKTFKNEIDKNVIIVKKAFDNLLEEIEKTNSNNELLEKNKMFLLEMNNKLSENKLVTSEEIKGKRVSDFESRLQKRQDEFTLSMKKEVPDEINFKDDADRPLHNVEEELQKKINERRYDNLNITNEDVVIAEKWIGVELNSDVSFNEIEEIHKITEGNQNDSFIPETDTDIFSKLKKVDDSTINNTNDRVLLYIKKIDRKIDMLIEYIQNIKK